MHFTPPNNYKCWIFSSWSFCGHLSELPLTWLPRRNYRITEKTGKDVYKVRSGLDMSNLIHAALVASAAFAFVFCGCISDQGSFNNIKVYGYVRKAADSTAVPNALVMVDIDVLRKASADYSDSSGYFEYRITTPTFNWNPVEVMVTVADVDGENNGVFVTRDTTLYDDNEEGESDLFFNVDFYVQMVEDTINLDPVPFVLQ